MIRLEPRRPLTRRLMLLAACSKLRGLEEPEELIPFSDYTSQFRVEAQPDNPRVKCFDLRDLTAWQTPAEQFFEFHQTSTPRVDVGRWRLRIGGCVERPAEFSPDDLKRRPDQRDVAVTLECSGNSSQPQLMNGLVSNAVWTGVSLASILKECGVKPEAREVVFLGLDGEREQKWQAGNQEFFSPHGRSIFIQDALGPEPLLAWKMNGEPLPPEHGFPLRLILPGWYGMAHVKWLSRIEVLDRRYEGRHMARNYHSLRAIDGMWLDTSISRNQLKSVVTRVTRRRVSNRFEYTVTGAAWGGGSRIEKVEVRIDGGPWRSARIGRRGDPFGWMLWSFDWSDATRGRHTVVSRAINAAGEVQPTREELRNRLASNREDNSQWPRSITIESV